MSGHTANNSPGREPTARPLQRTTSPAPGAPRLCRARPPCHLFEVRQVLRRERRGHAAQDPRATLRATEDNAQEPESSAAAAAQTVPNATCQYPLTKAGYILIPVSQRIEQPTNWWAQASSDSEGGALRLLPLAGSTVQGRTTTPVRRCRSSWMTRHAEDEEAITTRPTSAGTWVRNQVSTGRLWRQPTALRRSLLREPGPTRTEARKVRAHPGRR